MTRHRPMVRVMKARPIKRRGICPRCGKLGVQIKPVRGSPDPRCRYCTEQATFVKDLAND